jgi:hypothetical protein
MTSTSGGPEAELFAIEPFDCPRCHTEVVERLYGPCEACRVELRANVAGEARGVETEAYVPKMNVTPNAVALKDD